MHKDERRGLRRTRFTNLLIKYLAVLSDMSEKIHNIYFTLNNQTTTTILWHLMVVTHPYTRVYTLTLLVVVSTEAAL